MKLAVCLIYLTSTHISSRVEPITLSNLFYAGMVLCCAGLGCWAAGCVRAYFGHRSSCASSYGRFFAFYSLRCVAFFSSSSCSERQKRVSFLYYRPSISVFHFHVKVGERVLLLRKRERGEGREGKCNSCGLLLLLQGFFFVALLPAGSLARSYCNLQRWDPSVLGRWMGKQRLKVIINSSSSKMGFLYWVLARRWLWDVVWV